MDCDIYYNLIIVYLDKIMILKKLEKLHKLLHRGKLVSFKLHVLKTFICKTLKNVKCYFIVYTDFIIYLVRIPI